MRIPENGAAMPLASWKEEGGPTAAVPKESGERGAEEDTVPNSGAAGEGLGVREKLSGAAWPGELAAPKPAERKFILGTLLASCGNMMMRLALFST